LGYRLSEPEADIVIVSHLHPGHNYIEGVANEPKLIKSPGEYEIGGTFITGVATFHDNRKGDLRGKNTIYIIEMDDITLCHLGDLGHPLAPHLIEEIGDIDILFLPVGEVSTMPIDTAVEIVRQLEPPIVIPMHYKTETFTGDLSPVDKFLDKMRIRELEAKPKLSITSSSLPSSTQTIVLNYL
jgi:L-ascorbate metabolism protein UlaG (beta-lactamase superfamily)